METTLNLPDLPVALREPPLPRRLSHQLPPLAVLSLRGMAGSRVLVDSGRLWITESSDPRDHFVGAGQVYTIKGPGQVVLQNDSPAGASYRVEDRHGKPRVVSGF